MRPSACAVRRLITKSNLVDCATGRSIGLLPFRMNAGVEAHLTIRFRQAGPVAHQAASFGVPRARVIDRGRGMARRQPGKLDRRLRVTPVVFIVDDDVSVRESLEALIRVAGWQVEVFATAQEFLSCRRRVAANGPASPEPLRASGHCRGRRVILR